MLAVNLFSFCIKVYFFFKASFIYSTLFYSFIMHIIILKDYIYMTDWKL